jgi:hypothetical protein
MEMKRLLLCTVALLALTASANAQREGGNYMAGFYDAGRLGNIPKRGVCAWSIAPSEKAWCTTHPQQVRKPSVRNGR